MIEIFLYIIEDIWKLGVSMKYHQILMQVLI